MRIAFSVSAIGGTVRRPLTDREESVLTMLVQECPPAFDAALGQVKAAMVVGECSCGCATVDLDVDRAQASPLPDEYSGLLPVEGEARIPGETFTAGVIVFVRDGWLSGLEIYHVGDRIIREFPPVDDITVVDNSTTN